MAQTKRGFTRKKALTLILICAILLLLYFTARSVFPPPDTLDLGTTAGRAAYLKGLGWEIDPETESFRTVVVPQKLEGIMAQYNKIQLKQGLDLGAHLGQSCKQYSYEVTNYPGGEGKVIASLYIRDGAVIAGDIHSTAVNGFMHGLTGSAKETSIPRP